jgi:hypothetical protein
MRRGCHASLTKYLFSLAFPFGETLLVRKAQISGFGRQKTADAPHFLRFLMSALSHRRSGRCTWDAATLSAATMVLLFVALAASWFPARKAMHVDAMAALHEE